VVLAAIGLFVIHAAIKALQAPWLVDDFPEALAIKAELLPWLFPLHMVTGGLALIAVPLTVLLRRRARWHRLAGRITALIVLLAGITAFPVALIAPVTALSAWGFAAQGAVWLALLGLGLWYGHRRRFKAHRACMLLMAATTTGALFFRIYLALFAIWGNARHYEAFYACNAWIAWSLPLLAMAVFLKRTGALTVNPR
jgi:Predicted membrane protein (DUF2306)